jgi:hypothetical protein
VQFSGQQTSFAFGLSTTVALIQGPDIFSAKVAFEEVAHHWVALAEEVEWLEKWSGRIAGSFNPKSYWLRVSPQARSRRLKLANLPKRVIELVV